MPFAPRLALVTGASSGIGAAFARALAARGADLILVARRADRLDTLAAVLRDDYRAAVTTVPLDLALPDAVATLGARIAGVGTLDAVVNCAGFGTHGPFAEEDADRVREEIAVNIGAVVGVTRAFLPPMLAAGRGAIVNVASLFAYQPAPNMAVYGATKAFVLQFSEALWYEARQGGVKVLAVSPGPTRTEFFDHLGTPMNIPARVFQTPEQVVRAALRALDRRDSPPSIAAGGLSNLLSRTTRLLPRRAAIRLAAALG